MKTGTPYSIFDGFSYGFLWIFPTKPIHIIHSSKG
jgi:hypothetical protein